nr:hypothetical protein CFP56_36562 [Quercus suber]
MERAERVSRKDLKGQPYLQTMFTFREMLTSLAPFFTAAIVIVLSPIVKEHIPSAVSNYLVPMYEKWLSRFSTPQVTVVIEEKGNKDDGQNKSTIDIVENEVVIDKFIGIRLKWKLCAIVIREIKNDNNVVKLYTRDNGFRGSVHLDRDEHWVYVILEHPVTFEKLAML